MALDSMRRAYASDPIRERILAQEKAEGKSEVARKMKLAGFDSKAIGELTGLSQDEIDRL